MGANDRTFDYGPTMRETQEAALTLATVAASFLFLVVVAGRFAGGRGTFLDSPQDWILAGTAGLCILAASVLAFRTGRADENRRERLCLMEQGLEYRPRRPFRRVEFVAYREIKKLVVVNPEDSCNLTIEHEGGVLILYRDKFNDRESFEEFAAMVSARSGQDFVLGMIAATGG